ncbi:serine threonine-protein phosphatase 2a 55 kda regulatory subunit b beta isoform [Stylonychia lemnae]|uniref:Serine threonine-protein phosphatase 2a 55 kDa regulatory subunit b beta isoform n=1 Tax=Stylonychia lemnae TaxID=5949 RepID=A0A078AA39_STYLE|nr:serine threonine-protein phosphatase 2a 55 kda regulatory subunit b beta isoform [Stylonychia lemnae]|eukprot:CDW78751.1 serine threonine-protein phosphatase 2a 55 kda regulatory subunit b beta isoform [Stylonychia lemnae]
MNEGNSESDSPDGAKYPSLQFLTEFQSHEPEFNFQKTLEISEKVTSIEWINLGYNGFNPQLITTNDKVIKLFQIKTNKYLDIIIEEEEAKDLDGHMSSVKQLELQNQLIIPSFPKQKKMDQLDEGIKLRNTYINGHSYHIHSVSQSYDQECFLSADDITINLWNIEDKSKSYNILNIQPANIQDLQEVITHVEFHPIKSLEFIYSSSKGYFKICDMRTNMNVSDSSITINTTDEVGRANEYSEIINSCTWASFVKGESQYEAISRDFCSIKLWDIRMPNQPIKKYLVNDYVEDKLAQLYSNDCIFDRFDLKQNYTGNLLSTGGYNRSFQVIDQHNNQNVTLLANAEMKRFQSSQIVRKYQDQSGKLSSPLWEGQSINFDEKVLHTSWHPHENRLAVASSSCIFLYSQ